MITTKTRRILRITPVALALALGLGACGAVPCLAGNNGSAPISNSGVTSNGIGNAGGSQPLASGSTSGGLSGSSGGISSGSASGSTGQVGVSGGTSGGVSGLTSGGNSGGSGSASGLSVDEVAQYCKYYGVVYGVSTQESYPDGAIKTLNDLRPHTPVQLQQYIDVQIADDKLLANQTRIPNQVDAELKAAFQPLKDLHDQICV